MHIIAIKSHPYKHPNDLPKRPIAARTIRYLLCPNRLFLNVEVRAIPQAFNNQFVALCALVDVLDVV